jgi:hypothetical protein
MSKLLTAYSEARDVKTARKVVAYARKHPMSVCMLDRAECELLRNAEVTIENEG